MDMNGKHVLIREELTDTGHENGNHVLIRV